MVSRAPIAPARRTPAFAARPPAVTRLLLGGALLLLTPPLLSSCAGFGAANTEVSEILAYVTVVPVKQGMLDRSLRVTGSVEAGREVDLVPKVAGEIVSMPVKVGQEVRKGEVVARVDIEMALLQQQQAEAAVELAKLGYATASREYERAKALHGSGSLTDQQFEQAQAGFEMSGLQIRQASAAQGLARIQVDGGVLEAPFDGQISYIAKEVGQMFNPMALSMGGPAGLVGVVDLSTLKIDLQVSDRDISLVTPGMPAKIHVDSLADRLPPDGIEAVVDTVGVSADPVARTFPVRVVADNPDRIVRAGTHASVLLVLERAEDATYVPEDALLEGEAGPYVVLVDKGIARHVPVRIGVRGDDAVQVTGDIARDQQVIVRGHFGLPDGSKVEVSQ